MQYPITDFKPPEIKNGKVIKKSYFPNHKTEMLTQAYEKTQDLRYYQKAVEYSVLVMMGMVHTHKFYSVAPEDMRSYGAFTAAHALRSFDPTKPHSSSLFSYLSLAFYKASMTIRTEVRTWQSRYSLFEDLEGMIEEKEANDDSCVDNDLEKKIVDMKDSILVIFDRIELAYEDKANVIAVMEVFKQSYLGSVELNKQRIMSELKHLTGLNNFKLNEAVKIIQEEFRDCRDFLN